MNENIININDMIKSTLYFFKQIKSISSLVLLLSIFLNLPSTVISETTFQPEQIQLAGKEDSGKDLQFMGLVEPGQRMGIVLMPGEYVHELPLKVGDEVKKGDIIVKLSSDQLVGSLADLQQKKRTLLEERQQLQLLKLEIDLKEQSLARLNEEIANDKKLGTTVSGYFSPLSGELENQQKQLAGQITLLKARYDTAKQNEAGNNELTMLLEDQITEVRNRISALTVQSPFDGKVKYIAPDPHRVVPGQVLCEIWDESHLMVRGLIIQHQYNLIKPGDKVRISVDFISTKEVIGIVSSVGQSLNRSVNQPQENRPMEGYASFEVLIKIEAAGTFIQPGMMVSILKERNE